MTCSEFSITARASSTGFRIRVTPLTAPAFSICPSMMEASNSLRPSSVNTEPRPALNKGLSSSSATARATASRLLPPLRPDGHFSARHSSRAPVNCHAEHLSDCSLPLRYGHHQSVKVGRDVNLAAQAAILPWFPGALQHAFLHILAGREFFQPR